MLNRCLLSLFELLVTNPILFPKPLSIYFSCSIGGILQFGNEKGTSTTKYYESWGARQLAMQIYYSQISYMQSSNSSKYTDDIDVLSKFSSIPFALDGDCWGGSGRGHNPKPVINLKNDMTEYEAIVENEGYIASVDNKRLLTAMRIN